MSDTKLIPCPFCGNPDSLYRYPVLGKFQEYCDKCKARGPERDDPNGATAAWNTRALTPKQKAAEEMATALQECEEYFDSRADADHNGERFVGNAEINLLTLVHAALAAYRKAGQP